MRRTLVLLVVLITTGCREQREELPGAGPRVLFLTPAGGPASGDLPAGIAGVARVEIAADPLARQQGLMHREGLAANSGMLFVYPEESEREFWMKNTLIPLSIAYADAGGTIVRILEMEPGAGRPDGALPRYPSGTPAKYALEMESRWFARRGIGAGDRIELHPSLARIEPR